MIFRALVANLLQHLDWNLCLYATLRPSYGSSGYLIYIKLNIVIRLFYLRWLLLSPSTQTNVSFFSSLSTTAWIRFQLHFILRADLQCYATSWHPTLPKTCTFQYLVFSEQILFPLRLHYIHTLSRI
jgi:hypothetical protein